MYGLSRPFHNIRAINCILITISIPLQIELYLQSAILAQAEAGGRHETPPQWTTSPSSSLWVSTPEARSTDSDGEVSSFVIPGPPHCLKVETMFPRSCRPFKAVHALQAASLSTRIHPELTVLHTSPHYQVSRAKKQMTLSKLIELIQLPNNESSHHKYAPDKWTTKSH